MNEIDLMIISRNVSKDRRHFRKMLEYFVPQTDFLIPLNPRILNVGCGECYEATVLSGYFGEKEFGQESDEVHHVGIDKDPSMVLKAQVDHMRWFSSRKKHWPRPNYQFISGNAENLRDLVEGEFDIVVSRHPPVNYTRYNWEFLFGEIRHVVSPQNIFIGTTFFYEENENLDRIVRNLGYKVVLNGINPYSFKEGSGVSFDKNVLCAEVPKN